MLGAAEFDMRRFEGVYDHAHSFRSRMVRMEKQVLTDPWYKKLDIHGTNTERRGITATIRGVIRKRRSISFRINVYTVRN